MLGSLVRKWDGVVESSSGMLFYKLLCSDSIPERCVFMSLISRWWPLRTAASFCRVLSHVWTFCSQSKGERRERGLDKTGAQEHLRWDNEMYSVTCNHRQFISQRTNGSQCRDEFHANEKCEITSPSSVSRTSSVPLFHFLAVQYSNLSPIPSLSGYIISVSTRCLKNLSIFSSPLCLVFFFFCS